MLRHFHQDMEQLTATILEYAAQVEATIHRAIQALSERRADLARQVIEGDDAIDQEEVRIEEECIKILVRHEPVASDLRRMVAMLRINTDLERIADLAVNIAERAVALAAEPHAVPIPERLRAMTERAVRMVRDSLDAFTRSNAELARAVCAQDDEVDRLNREIIDELKALIRTDPETIDTAFHLFSAARHVERIADHATNIAEDVVYLTQGTIIRHQPEPAV